MQYSERDPRIDALRGMALLMIFCDHIPGNALSKITLHNFGFADAAEAFVLLAGFSAMAAYGRCIERKGWAAGLARLFLRCLRIYIVHVILVVTTLAVVALWANYSGLQATIVKPLLDAPVAGIANALLLMAQPTFLDILPLYIALLGMFPLLYLIARRSLLMALGVSGALWLAVNLNHNITLPKWNEAEGWYFNPFAWQFLFTIGVCLSRVAARGGGDLRQNRWLSWTCLAYLCFAFVETAPWVDWNMPDLRLLDFGPLDKSRLAWPRILNISAWAYLLLSSKRLRSLSEGALFRAISLCGRHSLEIFAVSCIVALIGRLAFRTYGSGLGMQVLVNLVGPGAMFFVAVCLARRRSVATQFERHPELIRRDGAMKRIAGVGLGHASSGAAAISVQTESALVQAAR